MGLSYFKNCKTLHSSSNNLQEASVTGKEFTTSMQCQLGQFSFRCIMQTDVSVEIHKFSLCFLLYDNNVLIFSVNPHPTDLTPHTLDQNEVQFSYQLLMP